MECVGRNPPGSARSESDGVEVPLLDRAANGGGMAADEASRGPGQHRPRPARAQLGRCWHLMQHGKSTLSVQSTEEYARPVAQPLPRAFRLRLRALDEAKVARICGEAVEAPAGAAGATARAGIAEASRRPG